MYNNDHIDANSGQTHTLVDSKFRNGRKYKII